MRTLRIVPALVALAAFALLPGVAGAQVKLGQTGSELPVAPFPCEFSEPYDEFQVSIAGGDSYTVPTPGLITSWSHSAGPDAGQKLGFKVGRVAGASFTVVGADTQNLTPSVLNTFPVAIPVQAGDVLGLHVFDETESAPTLCTSQTELLTDVVAYAPGDVAPGATGEFEQATPPYRLNVSATLLLAPTISALSPAKGSIKGGAKVVVTGTEFGQVQSVSFGSAAAKSFSVDSEGQITAVAPASKTIAKVPVTVTTAVGAATSASTFAYQGCKVPGLAGKKLKAAKKKLKKAGCKAGKVTKKDGATGKTGKVSKQSPKPGKLLAPGAKVKLTLKP